YQPRPFEKAYSPDDFYGGTLKGIEEKLPYLKQLGISCIYLNPIVEARSNHRYDASDYLKVDPILGSNEDFSRLCRTAEAMGIRIMLDGVFSHTGADSIYFNRHGNYPGRGACQSKESEFYPWYDFSSYPDKYRSWWGFEDLPEVNELNEQWQDFVISGENSVVKSWLRNGAAGWRLDVADELPDEVLALIRSYAKAEKPDAPILGEVWEDAVIKESYGGRRNYALGYSLDSVMNYPFRNAALDFCHWRIDAYQLRDFLISQQMNYPKPMYYSLMNLLGSHDTDRVRSALATDIVLRSISREDQLRVPFSEEALERANELEKLCAVMQFSIPGVPSVYYGDEQGMCGVNDPFNRMPFKESDSELHKFYTELAGTRNSAPALSVGEACFMAYSRDILMVLRYVNEGKDVFGEECENAAYLAIINRGDAADYEADCSAAGKGIVKGCVESMSAEIIKL
ncbi:MAG: glycoside hydrolase family 13 protein, partial [Oscillospiraceae bacterium]|nr:glycoside hydrolase family 13 protein [Oscillospiraceae bacterium]